MQEYLSEAISRPKKKKKENQNDITIIPIIYYNYPVSVLLEYSSLASRGDFWPATPLYVKHLVKWLYLGTELETTRWDVELEYRPGEHTALDRYEPK